MDDEIQNVTFQEGNQGAENLRKLVEVELDLNSNPEPDPDPVPIVLVSGFSGWGEALFGTFNYWGGFEDLPAILSKAGDPSGAGYPVIVVRIGPLSSNWERACEVFAQLSNGFDAFNPSSGTAADDSIPVDYGEHFRQIRGVDSRGQTKKAVLYGKLRSDWKWSNNNPVHFICHSQGGNTIRQLIRLLRDTHLRPKSWDAAGLDRAIKSCTTLGTPHMGTTVTNVLESILPQNRDESIDLIAWLITSVSFKRHRFYDLQLDHWGFRRENNTESARAMHNRILPNVRTWWLGAPNGQIYNGFYDNSIPGVKLLNQTAAEPSEEIFYFTMSFNATDGFPNIQLTSQDIAEFPHYPALFLWNRFAGLGSGLLNIGQMLPGAPSSLDYARFAVNSANRHLAQLGYFHQIPQPGPRVPRTDMLPLLAPSGYGMGGYLLRQDQLPPGLPTGAGPSDFLPNDGVVNTISMKGPRAEYIAEIGKIPLETDPDSAEQRRISKSARTSKKYWHFGTNKTMDHADEIGVFTNEDTFKEVAKIYVLLSKLLRSLP